MSYPPPVFCVPTPGMGSGWIKSNLWHPYDALSPGRKTAGMEDDKKPDQVPTERLEEALEQLESLGNANQALLKTLSHDLRTTAGSHGCA